MVPNGWNIKTLGNFCEFSQGFQVGVDAQMDSFAEGLVRFVRIVDYTKAFEPPRYVRKLENYYLVAKDDLVMVRYGEAGLICRGIEGVIANNLFRIKPKEQVSDKAYLYTWLEHHQIQISRLAASSTMPALKFSDLKSLNIVLPPISEQRKIAKILSTWDKAISTTERLIDNSKQQKKALMQQLLTGKKRLLDDSGKPFEGQWEEVKLKECSTCLDNKRIPLNSSQRQEMQGKIPYWGANGIVDYVNEHIFDETIVLLAEDGGYFDEFSHRPIANISYGKSWVNNHAHILKAKNNSLNEWLYYSLVHKNILAFINGGTRAKLNKSDMLLIPINLPPIEEQTKIADVLSNADKEIELLEQQLAELKQEKKALMQQLLTGKRRVKLDDKEVA